MIESPPLPEPQGTCDSFGLLSPSLGKKPSGQFTADQMTAYGQQCYAAGVAAERARAEALPKPGGTLFVKSDARNFADGRQCYEAALEAAAKARPCCPSCGTHEVSQQQTCHNSACEAYARDVTIYEGWRVQKSSHLASDPIGGD